MSDNVIRGPWGNDPLEQYDEDEKNAILVHEITVRLTSELFDSLMEEGFDNSEDLVYIKDLALIVQSVKSAIFKMQDRGHPLQIVAEEMLGWTDDGFVDIKPEYTGE